MKIEEQRLALAEWDEPHQKWEIFEDIFIGADPPYRKHVGYRYPAHSGWVLAKNYPNDLNAMHEAEKLLDEKNLQFTYSHNLYNIVVPENVQPFRATAAQRAEALLRTIGKWSDA